MLTTCAGFSELVELKKGMNLLSSEAWHVAVGNVADNVFINRPVNRKNALTSSRLSSA